ncbi:MAG: radical SAM family heme chaperone HemW [Gammaproteobacteria bacterium]|nr:radical SAM family heme chaperone HemW [Gammaproteobacteria bacterium]
MRHFRELPPLSLYVHIPWCVRKCPYCDFNSHEYKGDDLPEQAYIDALLVDLESELPTIWGRQIVSVFIGGGTPSLFSAESLDRLLSGLRALLNLQPTIEITMEANPGTIEQHKFAEFAQAGVNRLSMGIQSFNDASLQALGRIHTGSEAANAVEVARTAGFDNLNLDLMFALPKQTLEMAIADLDQAIALAPEHLSYYQLTLEPNTAFAANPPPLPHEDLAWDIQQQAIARLSDAGFGQYEISAYSQPGRRSEHNLNYWLFGDYIGIGAGAHGKISSAAEGVIRRRSKQRHPRRYLESSGTPAQISEQKDVSLEDTAIEFMMNAFRLLEGFSLPLFQQHTGVDLYTWQPVIDRAIEDGLLEQEVLMLRPTNQGHRFLNELLERFMPEEQVHTYPVIPLRTEQ